MTDNPKIRIVVDEDATIVARIDAIAKSESISRSDVLRRAIRRLVFSMPQTSTFGVSPEVNNPDTLVEA